METAQQILDRLIPGLVVEGMKKLREAAASGDLDELEHNVRDTIEARFAANVNEMVKGQCPSLSTVVRRWKAAEPIANGLAHQLFHEGELGVQVEALGEQFLRAEIAYSFWVKVKITHFEKRRRLI